MSLKYVQYFTYFCVIMQCKTLQAFALNMFQHFYFAIPLGKTYAIQIKLWLWVAHLFTITLMELFVMLLAANVWSFTFTITIMLLIHAGKGCLAEEIQQQALQKGVFTQLNYTIAFFPALFKAGTLKQESKVPV